MRNVMALAAAVAALLLAAGPLAGQGRFELKYTEADATLAQLLGMGRRAASLAQSELKDLADPPSGLSGSVFRGSFDVAGRTVQLLMTADAAKLYIDTNLDGKLSDEKPLEPLAEPKGPHPANAKEFGPVAVSLPAGGAVKLGIIAYVQVLRAEGQQVTNYGYCRVHSAGVMVGTIDIAGKAYKVALVDINLNGRYNDCCAIGGLYDRKYDGLAVDLNGNGQFEQDFRGDMETLPLTRMLAAGGGCYSLEVAADGSSITLAKVEPPLGTLDLGRDDVGLTLFGESGFHRCSGSGGKFQLPAGRYMVFMTSLTKTDDQGAKWSLDARFAPDAKPVDLAKDEVKKLALGPPLVLKVIVAPPASGGGATQEFISLSVVGQGGETYSGGAQKDGGLEPAPKFKILDESGKELASGQFQYG